MTRGRVLAIVAVSLVVLLGSTLAISAADPGGASASAPGDRPGVAQPAPTTTSQPATPPTTRSATSPVTSSPGLPLHTDVPTLPPCDPTVPLQLCAPVNPPTSTTPCSGEGCIPQPGATTTPPAGPGQGQPGEGGQPEDECGVTNIGACITEAMDAFFRGIVEGALNPLLDLLANTLLTTPMPDDLPRIGELWSNSWEILLVSYGLLVLIGGVLVMGYQTLQTRHSIKEIAPRIIVGFLAGALSLWVATKAILIANGLAQAVLGGGVDTSQPMVGPGQALKDMILGALTGGIWIIFLGIFLAGMLVVLLVTYVVRVALTLVLIAGAPLALMFHALPQTEGIAYWWWKALGGCVAIQVVQSLTLVTAMRVFFAPGGFTMFGPNVDGLVNLLVAMALMYILFKIPFWILGSLRGGGGRSLLSTLARGFIAYKTLGLLTGRRGRGPGSSGSGGRGGPGGGGRDGGRGPVDLYSATRATGDGQYVLPLTGVRRSRPAAKPKPVSGGAKPRGGQSRQLVLPLGSEWPENKPVLGRDGQYRLPLDVQRVTPPPPPIAPGQPGGRQRTRQLPLPLGSDWPENKPVLGRDGQYRLPLKGVRRVPRAKPAPTSSAARPAPRAGQQLRLPLDLPKPAPKPPRRTPPPSPKQGGKS